MNGSTTPAATSPGVLTMAAPLVISFWMRAAVTFVDTIYAALVGDAAVASIGLTIPFEFVMIAAWVGLSTGLTGDLTLTGKYIIVAGMFIGRLGPLTLLLAVTSRKRHIRYAYPEEDLVIG